MSSLLPSAQILKMSGPDLEKLDTQSSQASLLELDPSPVENPNDTAAAEDGCLEREGDPQTPPHPLFSRASNLGLGSHGPAFYRKSKPTFTFPRNTVFCFT